MFASRFQTVQSFKKKKKKRKFDYFSFFYSVIISDFNGFGPGFQTGYKLIDVSLSQKVQRKKSK